MIDQEKKIWGHTMEPYLKERYGLPEQSEELLKANGIDPEGVYSVEWRDDGMATVRFYRLNGHGGKDKLDKTERPVIESLELRWSM
jgi:hypothetical protein